MIDYDAGMWHVSLLLYVRGSVFPKAVAWAMPSAFVAYGTYYLYYIHLVYEEWMHPSSVTAIWSGFTFILGFLVVFRTQQAYSRYWEGVTLIRRARGEWFNAYSTLIAFTTSDSERREEVEHFHHLLARLMSVLSCVALQTITDVKDDEFLTLDLEGVSEESIKFLVSKKDAHMRTEVLIQWIQRLVVNKLSAGILEVPAPLLSNFFQELSRGSVNLNQARNATEIPFPFPYAQLLTVMLLLNTWLTPVLAGLLMRSGTWSSLFTFIVVLAFWGTNYIAAEIESPFGDDENDLPLKRMQEDVNVSIWTLLERQSQVVPQFDFKRSIHRCWRTVSLPWTSEASASAFHAKKEGFAESHAAPPKFMLRRSSSQATGDSSQSPSSSPKRGGGGGLHEDCFDKSTSGISISGLTCADLEMSKDVYERPNNNSVPDPALAEEDQEPYRKHEVAFAFPAVDEQVAEPLPATENETENLSKSVALSWKLGAGREQPPRAVDQHLANMCRCLEEYISSAFADLVLQQTEQLQSCGYGGGGGGGGGGHGGHCGGIGGIGGDGGGGGGGGGDDFPPIASERWNHSPYASLRHHASRARSPGLQGARV